MIKRHKGILILTSLIILLPILAGLFLWNQLPEEMPIHWNVAGEVDGYCGKPFAVFGLPAIMAAFHWICALATTADPKHDSHNEKHLTLVFWLIPVLTILLISIMYSTALGQSIAVDKILPAFMGILFTIIGNAMPKFKQNYTMGIKIPWTLNSTENWNKTHRLAGRLWVVCGIAVILVSFIGHPLLLIPILLVMVSIPLIYSYLLYRKESQAK